MLSNLKEKSNYVSDSVNHFVENGYVIINKALPNETVERLATLVDKLFEERKHLLIKPVMDLGNLISLSREFHFLIKYPPTFQVLHQLFGPDIALLSTAFRYSTPGTPNQAWHIDYKRDWENLKPEYPMWLPFPTVIAAYYLDDLTLENGALWVVPKSHKRPNRPPWEDISLPGELPLLVQKGGCILFDARLWHRGGKNSTQKPRRGLFFDYSLSWVKSPFKLEGKEVDFLIQNSGNDTLRLLGLI